MTSPIYAAIIAPVAGADNESHVTYSAARLHVYVESDGGEACEVRFQYYIQATGTWTDNETAWVPGYVSDDTAYVDITGLTTDTVYAYRGQIKNSHSTVNSSGDSFTTLASVGNPSDLFANPSATSVTLSWTKGSGADTTVIRFKTVNYPTDETDGVLAYEGTATSCEHSGLDSGTTYYYRVWGKSGSTYSASYDEVTVTTEAGAEVGDYGTPDTPGHWFLTPDYTNMSGVPGYDLVNTLADAYGIPRNVFWPIMALFFCIAVGLVVYVVAENLLLAVFMTLFAIVMCGPLYLIPGYVGALFIISATGIGFAGRRV